MNITELNGYNIIKNQMKHIIRHIHDSLRFTHTKKKNMITLSNLDKVYTCIQILLKAAQHSHTLMLLLSAKQVY